ncbi:MAG: protein-tyrosine-phosphatase [Bacteroidota bacterium]
MDPMLGLHQNRPLLPALNITCERLTNDFIHIAPERKATLQQLTSFIQSKINAKKEVYLNFICTHNSRRSHIAQLWAQAAAYYYGVSAIECFSGGTEATAFNPRAVKAMQDVGFHILKTNESDNPVYEVRFADQVKPITTFSKKYDDPFNHNMDFAAIMTCSHADENCPLVVGASARIAITYDDPKEFDNSPVETARYKERVQQIGAEILYVFSLLKI